MRMIANSRTLQASELCNPLAICSWSAFCGKTSKRFAMLTLPPSAWVRLVNKASGLRPLLSSLLGPTSSPNPSASSSARRQTVHCQVTPQVVSGDTELLQPVPALGTVIYLRLRREYPELLDGVVPCSVVQCGSFSNCSTCGPAISPLLVSLVRSGADAAAVLEAVVSNYCRKVWQDLQVSARTRLRNHPCDDCASRQPGKASLPTPWPSPKLGRASCLSFGWGCSTRRSPPRCRSPMSPDCGRLSTLPSTSRQTARH